MTPNAYSVGDFVVLYDVRSDRIFISVFVGLEICISVSV